MNNENRNGNEINSKDENSLFLILFRSKSLLDFVEKNEKLSESQKEKIENISNENNSRRNE